MMAADAGAGRAAGNPDSTRVFALLDDCVPGEALADAPACRSRLYTAFSHERTCTDPGRLDAVLAEVDADLRTGLHALLLADYEWGVRLQCPAKQSGGGALRILLFRELRRLSSEQVAAWLQQQDGGRADPGVAGIANVRSSVTRDAFDDAITRIHAALRDGDSYQVNYTYRLAFEMFGSAPALYRRLRARQPVPFGALLALPDGTHVLSLSPELFVEHRGGTIVARPMKGTASRANDKQLDARQARALAADEKNRAENLMIVDLLRNDLGKIARTGSVRVPALFALEPYASVWQMTSTVHARVRDEIGFADVLRALFPCGSITGAPKVRTMALIESIETTPRGLYTGAIGWLDPAADARPLGDFCLSVAIRTLVLEPRSTSGMGANVQAGTLGVGAGIVLDSVAHDEYLECALKARFLTEADPGFQLFETMYATREGVRHEALHVARVERSARYFGFPFEAGVFAARLAKACAALAPGGAYRMRATLRKDGVIDVSAAPLLPLAPGPVRVMLAADHGMAAPYPDDPLLRHKTTCRDAYDRAWRLAETHHAFDLLFFNRRGELTEGGRSTVFVRIDGRWVTPPLASGVLPGVMRSVLLADPAWQAIEQPITRADFERRDALVVCNALRGVMPAQLLRF
ncbi:Para-aminobenzoate synthetase component I (EC 2.6.1.85) / 4-amino-4-deoxychorismate lyase (EC 4.1.3.38) [Mycetohabitans rhizoxinica HKI 454]|uniref:Para-aminobenzoate synthetase component I n=1 Tax=Mycetohabitans rhizoxinica (strain DSM 19002 / CIP 109453 / HKI 454) TaxID=882378 RepID=E5AM94_MYCRK|nr:aminodeoxychorismate synthase component I [Mycetohabitans rhizoxinica]CBW73971.1 Para-aminobenzoate synthetase component I (EC 2.6.1.85) / 4-amino-4-deoxychorismate lyase (EC 4.1.3.38) [Mycetohabitans rhizoxinica HKI 454]